MRGYSKKEKYLQKTKPYFPKQFFNAFIKRSHSFNSVVYPVDKLLSVGVTHIYCTAGDDNVDDVFH